MSPGNEILAASLNIQRSVSSTKTSVLATSGGEVDLSKRNSIVAHYYAQLTYGHIFTVKRRFDSCLNYSSLSA